MNTLIRLSFFISLAFLLSGCKTQKINTISEWENAPAQKWQLIPLNENTCCSDSSEYFIFSKKGNSNNLIIHFAGGGACWDGVTCSEPFNFWRAIKVGMTHNLNSYYIPKASDRIPFFLGGIFSDKAKNPLHDWNVVYIPYCTADLHAGEIVNTYLSPDQDTISIHHNGKNNVAASLDWAYQTFKNPAKVIVTGESAGGYGAFYYTKAIAQHYEEAKMYQLVDCSYALIDEWQDISNIWNAQFDTAYYSYREFIEGSYDINHAVRPITFLQLSSVYDFILPQFRAKLNADTLDRVELIQKWSQEMRTFTRNLYDSDKDYRYFLTDYSFKEKKQDTPHTFISFDSPYFKCKQDEIKLADWIAANVVQDSILNVGTAFLSSENK